MAAMIKWWGIVLVAIPVIVVSIVCFLAARKSKFIQEEDRVLDQVVNLTLTHAASGCTEKEINNLKKAFLKTREDKKYLHEHNELLEQEKSDLKSELRLMKEELSDYKDKLTEERERHEDECRHKNRTKAKKPDSDESIREILVRVKSVQQHNKENMERKDKEITELKQSIEYAKSRENQLRGLVQRLKESCHVKQESHSSYDENEPKYKPTKENDDDDKFDDLMHDIPGTEKPRKHRNQGYRLSTEDSDLDLLRAPGKLGHDQRGRYKSLGNRKGSDLDDERKTRVNGHGYFHETSGTEAGRNRGVLDVTHKYKSDAVHHGKARKSGHGFGEWAKEYDPDDFNNVWKTKPLVKNTGNDQKEERQGAERRKPFQNWKENDGLAGKGGEIDKSREGDKSTDVDQYDIWKQRHKGKVSSNDPIPNPRADLFPDTGYFSHGSDNPPPKHLSQKVIDGRKKIKVYFGKKEIKLHHKDENESKKPAADKKASKTTQKVPSHHSIGKHSNDSHSKNENKTSHGMSGSVQTEIIDHGLDGNRSLQSLRDKIEQVTTVKKGAVKNFKMVLDSKQVLSGVKEGNLSANKTAKAVEKKEKKKMKGKGKGKILKHVKGAVDKTKKKPLHS